jgi:hypothetical protein
MSKTRTEIGGQIVFTVTAAASIGLAILHIFGVLDIPWVNSRIPVFHLVLTGLVASFLAFETRDRLDKMPDRIGSALRPSQARRFDKIEEVVPYVIKQMNKAQQIDDLTWGPPIYRKVPHHKEAYDKYRQQIAKLRSKKSLQYREVMTFCDLDRVATAEEILKKRPTSYELRYYETDEAVPPLMRFILIDEEAIFVHYHHPGSAEEGVVWLSIKDRPIIQMLRVYYAEIWENAKPLTEGDLQKLRTRLATQAASIHPASV